MSCLLFDLGLGSGQFMVADLFDQSEDFRLICFTVIDDIDDVCCSSQCECIDSGDISCLVGFEFRAESLYVLLSRGWQCGVTSLCCWSLVSLDLRFGGVGLSIQSDGNAVGGSTLVVLIGGYCSTFLFL
jgi:hypothetical protein